jgi:hypothetical protein
MTTLDAKLRTEMKRWGQKSYAELAQLKYPQVYEVGTTGKPDWCKIEVCNMNQVCSCLQSGVSINRAPGEK